MNKTTLLIPTLNSSKYLKQFLLNIKKNNNKIDKIIFVDGGSKDNTRLEIIKSKNKKIIFITKKNFNISKSLDYGLNKVRTKFTSRIDSDDLINDDRISKQIRFLQNNQKYVFVGSNYKLIDQNSKKIYYSNLATSYDEIISAFLVNGDIEIAHPCVTFKTNYVKSIKGYGNYNFSEDYNLWIKILFKRKKFCNLKENLTNLRHHDQQKSQINNMASIKFMKNSYKNNINRNLNLRITNNFVDLLMVKYLKKPHTINEINNFYKKKIIINNKIKNHLNIKYNLDKIFYNEINNYNLNLNYNFFKKYYLLKLIFLNDLFTCKKINRTQSISFFNYFYSKFIFLTFKFFLKKIIKLFLKQTN